MNTAISHEKRRTIGADEYRTVCHICNLGCAIALTDKRAVDFAGFDSLRESLLSLRDGGCRHTGLPHMRCPVCGRVRRPGNKGHVARCFATAPESLIRAFWARKGCAQRSIRRFVFPWEEDAR